MSLSVFPLFPQKPIPMKTSICLSFSLSLLLAPGFLFPLLWLSRVIEYPELNILLNPVAQTGLFLGERLVSAVGMKPRLAHWGGQDGYRLGT